MNRVWFPAAWYIDATRTDHAVLYPDKKISTTRGELSLPAGGNVLYLRCANFGSRLCVGGQGHQDGLAWLWNGFFWSALTQTYGTSPCAFGPLGLYVSTPNAADNIKVYDVETLELVTTMTKAIGARGIAAVTGLGMNPSDVHSVDEWYGAGGLAEYTDLGDGLLVGQGTAGGLCANNGGALTELEPGSVQFCHATLDGTVISTAAWKDQETGAVIVRADRSELNTMPEPVTDPRFWLHPNIASADLLQVIDQPDVLAKVGVFGLYVQQIIFDDPSQGPNTWQALQAADFYRKLHTAGVPLNIEIGSVKGGDCQCVNALHNLEWCVDVVRDHGGDVAYLTQDEPLTAWINSCSKAPDKRTIEQIADSVAAWMKRATELGVPHVGWAEAWPHVGFAVQQQFLDLLQARGVKPSHWHLDIDWVTAGSDPKVSAFIKAATALAEARGITLGLMVNTTVDPIPTDAQHFANLAALSRKLWAIDPNAKHVVVQSWARRIKDGPQTVPNNLGASGLVQSLSDTMFVFGDVEPPDPEPPPVEIDMTMAYSAPVPGFSPGALEPHPDGGSYVLVRKPNGKVLCITPQGQPEERDHAGPWERFVRSKSGTALIAERDDSGTAKTYVLSLAE
jgi:hypothetical protein